MRLSDLRDKEIRTLDGRRLGWVHDVHCDKGKIVALAYGPGSFIERFTARQHGQVIAWDRVRHVEARQIVVSDAPARGAKKSGAARTRQGTRRASAPRSKR